MSYSIAIQDLWSYVLNKCPDGCKASDLSVIARKVVDEIRVNNQTVGSGHHKTAAKLSLVIDTRDCLDRLYGGFYNDWICGGGWNRMTTFLQELSTGLQKSNIRLVPIFNGALELSHIDEWHQSQLDVKSRLANIFQYLNNAAMGQWKPPPKVWWVAPSALDLSMRMAFRYLNMLPICTTEEHAQEVIDYVREHNCHGLLAESAVYMIFQPPRLFSSNSFKLKFSGRIDIVDINVDTVARSLDLNPNRFTLLAALLGNHILPAKDLHDFYCDLLEIDSSDTLQSMLLFESDVESLILQVEPDKIIESVLNFVRRLENTDPESVGNVLFRSSSTSSKSELISKLKESIQYYANGTQESFEKFKPLKVKGEKLPLENDNMLKGEADSNSNKKEALPLASILSNQSTNGLAKSSKHRSNLLCEGAPFFTKHNVSAQLMREASERLQKGTMHPWIYQILSEGAVKMNIGLENEAAYDLPLSVDLYKSIRQLVYGVLFDTHKWLMKPTVKESSSVDCAAAGAAGDATKSSSAKTDGDGEQGDSTEPTSGGVQPEKTVIIDEYVVRKQQLQCENVKALGLEWKSPIPPCESLWYGKSAEDKNNRLHAFMSCMGHDMSTKLLDTMLVPPEHVILCCVLRFLLKKKVIRDFELKAFLAQAVSPLLHNVEFIMKLELPYINARAVQLAALFMKGVEHAIFVNDACGAPIPWNFTSPWNYFDGKLFQYTYQMMEYGEPLPKVIGFPAVNHLVRLQDAIMSGLHPSVIGRRFTSGPPVPPQGMRPPMSMSHMPPMPHMPNDYLDLAYPGGGGSSRRGGAPMMPGGPFPANQYSQYRGGDSKKPASAAVDFRGGKLEVGGIVVSNWGPNMQAAAGRGRGRGASHEVHSSNPGNSMNMGYRGGHQMMPPTSMSMPHGQQKLQNRMIGRGGFAGRGGFGQPEQQWNHDAVALGGASGVPQSRPPFINRGIPVAAAAAASMSGLMPPGAPSDLHMQTGAGWAASASPVGRGGPAPPMNPGHQGFRRFAANPGFQRGGHGNWSRGGGGGNQSAPRGKPNFHSQPTHNKRMQNVNGEN